VPYFLALCSLVLAGGLFIYGFRQLAKARVVEGKNPMRIGSVRGGFFAFRGRVESLRLLRSPHSGKDCVYFNVLEEEYVPPDDSLKKNPAEWRTVRRDEQAVEFLLDDGSGKAQVLPDRAEWHLNVDVNRARSMAPSQGVQVSFGSRIASDHRRTTETYVLPGDMLYVIGNARPATGAARMTISREGAPVFLITDKPKGDLMGGLRVAGYGACVGGAFFVLLPVLGLVFLSAMDRKFGTTPPVAMASSTPRSIATPPPAVAIANGGHCRDVARPRFENIWAIGGRSSSDLWVAGDAGMIAHCDGSSWKMQRVGSRRLRAIAARKAGGVFVVGERGTALSATRDSVMPLAVATTGRLVSIWTGPDGYGWAVGGVAGPIIVTEKEGVEWDHPAGYRYSSVDRPVIVRVQGDRWVEVPYEGRYVLDAVWGSSASDVWAGGDSGFLVRWDGMQWTKQKSPTQQGITSIAGSGTFGVMLASVYYHRYGSNWSHMRSEKVAGRVAWAASPSSAWTAGTMGEVTRWDGNAWTTQRPAISPVMLISAAIHGFSDSDVWVATGPRLSHWDGSSWKE